MAAIITLTTDFGTIDGFVGAMKGVILSRAPDALIIDITHDIPAQSIRYGARALKEAASEFPSGTIHVAVVDPGVGSARRPLLLRSTDQLFVGPDNGVLSLAARAADRGWILDRPKLHRAQVSKTFHGRDIFASVAGHLAAGLDPEDCGSPAESWLRLTEPEPLQRPTEIIGKVVHVDRFGNLITNIANRLVGDPAGWEVTLNGRSLGRIHSTFSDVEPGEWVAYHGSSDTLEIAIRDGSAAEVMQATMEAEVTLCKR